ncbi:ankyrin repeat domain-containing protein 50 [Coprinopsis cinerea AmutBmut pab1-1]|nr:ankyrin repeat domain-containing protein 50 [Coprinopsis cinerea AmutBmut pab1-1]
MGAGISFVMGRDEGEGMTHPQDEMPMPGEFSPTASSPPVSMTASEVPFTGRQPARQEDSLQVTPNRPTMTDSGVDETDRHPHDAISQGRRESALAIDTGSLQENLSTPTHFDLQGSSISGNPMFVGGNVTQVVVAQPDERLERILDWLAPNINFRSIYIENLEKCEEGTLSWFLTGDKYDKWKKGKIKVIWGTGIPGSGKTVLASRLIENLEPLEKRRDKKTCILYAYCRYTEALTVKDILEGLIKQCLQRHTDIAAIIVPILERHRLEKTRPSLKELMDLLRTIEEHFDVVFYIIDGLDEAHITTQFDLVEVINSLKGRVAITSRPLQTLEGDFHSVVFYPVHARREDIERLVKAKILRHSHLRRLLKQNRCEVRVVSEILDKSGGMFIHAALQVQALAFCRNVKDLEDVLNNLPVSLEDMYRQTVQRIKAQHPAQADLGIRTLLWVVFSEQPLHIMDLLYAVAADPETHVFDEERMVDQATLISACCGLIEVEHWGFSRLVHYTAQEALSTILLECYPNPHVMIVPVLLERLVSLDLPQSPVKDEDQLSTILQAPLARYAYRHWGSHFNHCKPELTSEVFKFFKQCTSYPLHPRKIIDRDLQLERVNALHLAAFYDLASFVPKLVTVDGDSLDGLYNVNSATDTDSITPLFLASWLGHVAMIEELLVYKIIDPNVATKHGTALVQVVQKAHNHSTRPCEGPCPTLARLLQINGIQVNAVDQLGKTALMYAVATGAVPLVEQLLKHPCIDVNAVDIYGDTALTIAARARFSSAPTILRLLLREEGIQVNATNRRGQTALIGACCTYSAAGQEIIEELIKCDHLDVNAADGEGDTALICAVRSCTLRTIRLLLQVDGIQVNAANRHGQTALIAALKYRTGNDAVEVAQELCKFDRVDVNARDKEGNSALNLAMRYHRSLVIVHPVLQSQSIKSGIRQWH